MPENASRRRLETWGEIATHLGLEVRTAQRYRARLGLPVHRIAGTQRVFAYADELDAWWAEHQVQSQSQSLDEHLDTGRLLPPSAGHHRPYGVIAGGLALTVALALAMYSLAPRREAVASAAVISVTGNQVSGVDPVGTVRWSYQFDEAVTLRRNDASQLRPAWSAADVTGDGRPEWLVILEHRPPNGAIPSEALHAFSDTGELLWSYLPNFTVQFGDQRYGAPWRIWDVETIDGAVGPELWVSIGHNTWWPALVVSLDAEGTPTVRFINPGFIYVLRQVSIGGRLLVAAGGINNEKQAAALAIIDPDVPLTVTPTSTPSYAVRGFSGAAPEYYFTFSRTPANPAAGLPYNEVNNIWVSDDGIVVSTLEATPGASVLYQLNESLEVIDATPTDGYWLAVPAGADGVPRPPVMLEVRRQGGPRPEVFHLPLPSSDSIGAASHKR